MSPKPCSTKRDSVSESTAESRPRSVSVLPKTGQLDRKFHRWLLDAFDRRIQGDYGVDASITDEEVKRLIDQAVEFLGEARRYLGKTP